MLYANFILSLIAMMSYFMNMSNTLLMLMSVESLILLTIFNIMKDCNQSKMLIWFLAIAAGEACLGVTLYVNNFFKKNNSLF